MKLKQPPEDLQRKVATLLTDPRYLEVLKHLQAEWRRSYSTMTSPPDRLEFHAGVTATLDQVYTVLTNGRSIIDG